MPEVTSDDIAEAALKPKSATIDGNTVAARDIRELREAKADAAGDTAGGRSHLGLRSVQLVTQRPQ